MYRAELFHWSVDKQSWIPYKTEILNKEIVDLKLKNAGQLSEQNTKRYFYKFDCYDNKNKLLGTIYTLNPFLFL